jgi:PadR family transcriptional regulator, regulatory protein PadR
MAKPSDLELLQGTLDLLVLRTLVWGPRHGYAVARWIEASSRDELAVEDRALYVALHRLEQRGHVRGFWGLTDTGRRAKFYEITTDGRAELTAKHDRWARYVRAVAAVMRAEPVAEGV